MRELIRGYAAATFETAFKNDRLDVVVSDLTGFARVFSSSDLLRLALTDSSIAPSTRRDIVVDLIEHKVAPETAALLSFVVRTERAGEIGSTTNSLVSVAEHAASAHGAESEFEPQATHGAVRERIRGYAERVFQELTSVEEVDDIEDDLFRFSRILDDNPVLRRALSDVNASYEVRSAIISDLVAGRAQATTVRIIDYVMRAGRVRDLVGIFERLVELAAAERGRRVGEVRSAVELDDAERARLASALERLVERPVEVRVIHDPSVIGGALVSVGDLIIDGTVRIRFERLRDLLAEAG